MSDEQWVPGNKSELMSAIEREWNSTYGCCGKTREGEQNDHA